MNLSLSPTSIVMILVSLILSLSLHEMMHAYVGLKLGDTTAYDRGRISLNPLVHIDPFLTIILPAITLIWFGQPFLAAKPVPFDPSRLRYKEYGPAMVAAAGPLTNLALAAITSMVIWLVGSDSLLLIFAQINIALFVFNMIPIPPLDGSRVLYAVAPEPVQDFMAQLEQFGFIIIFGLVLVVPGFATLIGNIDVAITQFLRLPL